MTVHNRSDQAAGPDAVRASTDAARFEHLVVRDERPRSRREALGALVALLLLLVGVPALLWVLSGPPPVPTELPVMRELAQQLDFEDVLTVLIGVVWIAWLVFVVSVVLEIVAARRGGLASTVPLAGPFQRLARLLIGALLLTGVVATPAQAATAETGQPGASTSVITQTLDAPAEIVEQVVEEQAAAEQAGQKVYVVKAPRDGYHDNLWDIAERHLGEGRRYHEIFELNKDRLQPDGRKLELARLIQPGWELIMPADAVGIDVAPAVPAPASTPADPAPAAPDSASADHGVLEAVGSWPGGSGVLAASVLGALMLMRRHRIGRRPGEDARAVEADLRVAASTDRIVWLDRALRHLTRVCRAAGVTPPPVLAVVLSDDVVELLLTSAAADGVDGWTIHDEGRRWRLKRSEEVIDSGDPVPYPALVSLGVDLQERDVLVDLEAAGGIVSIAGSPTVAEQVSSAIAIQAATAPWADAVRVSASDLPDGIGHIGIERLDVVDDLGAELESLAEHVAALPDDVLRGRIGRRAAAPARLVVAGRAPAAEVADRLGSLAGGSSRALSVVVAGEHPSARWRIRVDDRGNLEMPQLGIAVVANRLGPEQVAHVADLFVAGRESEPNEERTALPALTREVDDAAWATAACTVGVLGRVAVGGAGDGEPARVDQVTEIVTYLALHPEGTHPSVLGAAIWPRGVTPDVVEAAIERARAWLGTDLDGTHLLRVDPEGRLLLADAVACDWHVVTTLLHAARRTTQIGTEADLLRRALSMVRGEPFERTPRGRYAWVARDDLPRTIARVLVDAAERLVQLRGGDPDGAGHAAEAGLLVAPGHQPLWRSLLRSRHAAEGAGGVHRTLEAMSHALQGAPLDAETEALIDELLPPAPDAAQA